MLDRWLFVSDVDDTLLGDDDALADLAAPLRRAGERLIIVYNSSRPCTSLRKTLADITYLLVPQFLVGGMGTEIEEGVSGRELVDYRDKIGQGWQRDKIAALMDELGFEAHDPQFQTPLKASYNVPDVSSYRRVLRYLEAAGLQAKVVYSSGKNLDIIPSGAGKGRAVEYLRQRLGIKPQRVIVAGDSGNDLDMFVPPFKGIVVANAHPELKKLQGDHIYHAKSTYAAGVLEGLRFWGIVE